MHKPHTDSAVKPEVHLSQPVTDKTKQERHPLEQGKVFLIDKPLEWTSFNVVSRVRNWAHRIVGHRVKTGHAGTLDPLATGLLIVCTGSYTKKIEEFQGKPKEYTGTFILGATTKSHDLESEVEPAGEFQHLTIEDVKTAALKLTGDIMQVPPVFSAVKINGKRAYQFARKDQEVDLQAKPIHIYEFEITRFQLPEVDFRIVCSKGTYIRSIARDFGKELGCGAYLSALRRTKIGDFRVEDAQDIEEFLHSHHKSEPKTNQTNSQDPV